MLVLRSLGRCWVLLLRKRSQGLKENGVCQADLEELEEEEEPEPHHREGHLVEALG